jgi:hypothetical protein
MQPSLGFLPHPIWTSRLASESRQRLAMVLGEQVNLTQTQKQQKILYN